MVAHLAGQYGGIPYVSAMARRWTGRKYVRPFGMDAYYFTARLDACAFAAADISDSSA